MPRIDFSEFFEAVNRFEPFPWQVALADRVAAEGWPASFRAPTGLGKTAVLDVAVWALAEQASLGAARTAPIRTYLIVDRRLVVDQAHRHARQLAAALAEAVDGPVADVARSLREIGEPDGILGEPVLTVVRMRGGTTWASRWVRRPDLPAIGVGTVDQLGSRLLFRGYGVGPRRLAIDAALVGCDSLVIVDEVHLSRPFVETIQTIGKSHESSAAQRAGRPVVLVTMSATLPEAGSTSLISEADRDHEVAGPRLRAAKWARLATTDARNAPAVFAALARCHLTALDAENDTVAVIVNTVGMARRVFDEVRAGGTRAVLLIGRIRGADRERVAAQVDSFRMGAQRAAGDPVVVVATQTIEVGVDLDVGGMVTESAPLDSLVQRLGRLDRAGRRELTQLTVVRVAGDDPVYGPPSEKTWEMLVELGGAPGAITRPPRSLEDAGPSVLNLGTEAMDEVLAGVDRRLLMARTEPGPPLLRAVLDVWARTSPLPLPDEPVAAYLHGLSRPDAVVQLAWRATPEPTHAALRESLDLLPVRSQELVEVPRWEAIAFLERRAVHGGPDVPWAAPEEDEAPGGIQTACVRVDGDEIVDVFRRDGVRAGAILVVPSGAGGYDEWGWTGRPGDHLVPDVADRTPRGGSMRLLPEVLEAVPLEGVDLGGVVAALTDDSTGVDEEGVRDAVLAVAQEVWPALDTGTGDPPPWERPGRRFVFAAGERLPRRNEIVVTPVPGGREPPRGVVLRWLPERPDVDGASDLEPNDDFDLSTSCCGARVDLVTHSTAVGDAARRIAERLGLERSLVESVATAGLAHDLGKADPRFQLSLFDGDPQAMEADGRTLAKSGRRARHTRHWPRGLRHEALSVTVLDELLDRLSPDVDRDLVLHLVASHHGYARPLFPASQPRDPVPFEAPAFSTGGPIVSDGVANQVDWDHPRRFANLCRRYGWWGLAMLETIVRSADVCSSEEGT